MSINFASIEHAVATAVGWLKKEAAAVSKFVAQEAVPALQKVEGALPAVEALSALLVPSAVPYERAGEAALAALIAAIQKAQAAPGAIASDGSITVTFAADLVGEVKTLIPAVQAKLADVGVKL